jgi:hypothetical protein
VLAKSQKDGILTALKADEFLATLNKLNITVDPDYPVAPHVSRSRGDYSV